MKQSLLMRASGRCRPNVPVLLSSPTVASGCHLHEHSAARAGAPNSSRDLLCPLSSTTGHQVRPTAWTWLGSEHVARQTLGLWTAMYHVWAFAAAVLDQVFFLRNRDYISSLLLCSTKFFFKKPGLYITERSDNLHRTTYKDNHERKKNCTQIFVRSSR